MTTTKKILHCLHFLLHQHQISKYVSIVQRNHIYMVYMYILWSYHPHHWKLNMGWQDSFKVYATAFELPRLGLNLDPAINCQPAVFRPRSHLLYGEDTAAVPPLN